MDFLLTEMNREEGVVLELSLLLSVLDSGASRCGRGQDYVLCERLEVMMRILKLAV